MKNFKDYTPVGTIVNTRGIRGEVKIIPLSTEPERFKCLSNVFVGDDLEPHTVEKVTVQGETVYMVFQGKNNINDVLKYKTKILYIYDGDRIVPKEGEYFVDDLIGMTCVDTAGHELGILKDIIDNPANDVYVIQGADEFMVPAVHEFVKDIDLEGRTVTLSLIEGMLP